MNLLFSLLGLSGNFTRHMWNGNDIVWYHLIKLYNDELGRNLKLIPKLTSEHFNLTPFSVMNVRLASQVLSETVSRVIKVITLLICIKLQNCASLLISFFIV